MHQAIKAIHSTNAAVLCILGKMLILEDIIVVETHMLHYNNLQ